MRLNLTAAVVAALCSVVAGIVLAATTVGSLEPASGTWRAYRGTGFATLVCSGNSEAAVLACAAADAERRTTTTRYQIRYPNRYATVTYSVPVPPPSGEWMLCATEGQRCSFTDTRRVRYGAGTTWIEATFTGGVPCTNHDFGRDPLPGVPKRCETLVTVAPALGSAPLSWRAPTTNTDGTALTNLAGYRVVYGQSIDALTQTVQIANPGVTSYALTDLAPGTYYFAVKAYTSAGTESAASNLVVKVIQ